jgi:glutamate-1-semialdehyde 2,1-aminomutase
MKKFINSAIHLARAELTIPLGSQTFSKSKTQYPVGISPLYAKRAKGAFLWDIDDNKYIDLVSALASVTLGYGDIGVAKAVSKQLENGVSLSLPTKLEAEVSELITELVPSAEMVRFSKNGSDATAAAIRLARAYTGRDHIIVCGYHGWHDWYVGSTTRDKGIPQSTIDLTHSFKFNNVDSLEETLKLLENKVAAVIIEPMNTTYPNPNFLSSVKSLTHKSGAILIFDEVITGFRFAKGGAQELFGVTPDLSTFGKGIANGFPLSAVVGRKEIMKEMENVFLSGTFGGELLSLAAAKNVLTRHKTESICEKLFEKGKLLEDLTNQAINDSDLSQVLSLTGHPTWKFLNWSPVSSYTQEQIRTYFMQEIFQKGILVLNSHNVTLAHGDREIKKVAESYFEIFQKISKVLKEGNLEKELKVKPLVPLFKIR